MRQIFGDVRWEAKAAVFFSLVVLFSVVGPFGSYERMTLAERFTYWTVIMIGIGFFMHVFMTMALASSRLLKVPAVMKVALGAAVAAIPGAAIVEFASEVFHPSGIKFPILFRTWAQVTAVGTVVGIVEYIDWRKPASTAPEAKPVALQKRLSSGAAGDIISLSMQDHYVEVTTTAGKEMILMRLTDAIKEVAPLPGQRIHRSHWVAAAHVRKMAQSGKKARVTLSDGRSLPVSATYVDAVRTMVARTT